MKFRIDRDVTAAEGTQSFTVEAVDITEACLLFKAGKGDLIEHDVEVVDLSEINEVAIYEADEDFAS